MPPCFAVPMKTDGQHSRRLNSSVQSFMEFNRNELSKPWTANRTDDKSNDKKKQKHQKVDPPDRKSVRRDRVKKEAMSKLSSSRSDLSPEPRSAKSKSSCVQSVNVVSDEVSKSSRREQTKAKDPTEVCCRPHQSRKAVRQASKKLPQNSLYEEFPTTKVSTLDDPNQSSNLISRDEHGLFVEEVDWKSTSVVWGDDEILTRNKLAYPTIRRHERNAKSMVVNLKSGQSHSSTNEDCRKRLSRSFII